MGLPTDPPTLTGFQTFLANVVGIPAPVLSAVTSTVTFAYEVALLRVNKDLAVAGTYSMAVYNLGASLVINYAQDTSPSTYFATIRGKDGLNLQGFSPGVVSATGDENTSVSILVPDFFKNLTMDDLQRLKDPYGRQYLAFAQEAGPSIWGIS